MTNNFHGRNIVWTIPLESGLPGTNANLDVIIGFRSSSGKGSQKAKALNVFKARLRQDFCRNAFT
jgi:hypothetical protein